MFRPLPLLSFALLAACSSKGSSTISSTGGSGSTGSGGASSSSDCINMGSCYGNVACPVGSVCFENTYICCAYSGGSTGSNSSSRESSTSHSSSRSSSHSSSSSSSNNSGSSSGAVYTGALDAGPPYVGGGWPKWHYDNADQGRSPADTSKNDGTLIWKFSVGVPMMSTVSGNASSNPNPTYMNSPVVDGAGVVYQLGMDGTFYALGDGGARLWTALLLPPNPDEHPATPIIAHDNTLYVETGTDSATTNPAQLYHIDTATGKIIFQSGPPLQQQCYGGTTPDSGICYSADGFDVCPSIGQDGLLFDGDDFFTYVTYKLEPDGSFTQFNDIPLLPLAGERVALALDQHDNSYWCASNTCLGVTSPSAGFSIMSGWNATVGAQIGAAPSNGLVWTTSDLAYDQEHTGWLMVEAGVQDGGTGSTEVVAMDTKDGSLHWDTKLPSGPTPGAFYSVGFFNYVGIFSSDVGNSAPAVGADGTVFVGNVDGLYALDGGTGAIQTGFPYKPSQDTGPDADVDTAPAIGGDGTIFFGTAGGTFYAIKPDGTERFHYKTGGRISSSPAIGPDGTVFFVSDDGFLYAIR